MWKKRKLNTLKTRVLSLLVALTLLLPIIPLSGALAASTLNVISYGANGNDTNDD
jgi:hypothetical protein